MRTALTLYLAWVALTFVWFAWCFSRFLLDEARPVPVRVKGGRRHDG